MRCESLDGEEIIPEEIVEKELETPNSWEIRIQFNSIQFNSIQFK
jgi:hypothetical protein